MPRSTQAEWIGAIGVQLTPLVQAMREDLLSRAVLHADETPVPTQPASLMRKLLPYHWVAKT